MTMVLQHLAVGAPRLCTARECGDGLVPTLIQSVGAEGGGGVVGSASGVSRLHRGQVGLLNGGRLHQRAGYAGVSRWWPLQLRECFLHGSVGFYSLRPCTTGIDMYLIGL
jgi:hypothetical protein